MRNPLPSFFARLKKRIVFTLFYEADGSIPSYLVPAHLRSKARRMLHNQFVMQLGFIAILTVPLPITIFLFTLAFSGAVPYFMPSCFGLWISTIFFSAILWRKSKQLTEEEYQKEKRSASDLINESVCG